MTPPNFGGELRRLHLPITRGVQVSAEAANIYAHEGFPDEEMRTGFRRYVEALVAVLQAHLGGEEEMTWPLLRQRLPDVSYDTLRDEHRAMEGTLQEITKALEARDMRIFLHLQVLQEQWTEHRSLEETELSSEATASALTSEDHESLAQQLADHMQAVAQPSETVLPFILYNLPPGERSAVMQRLRPAIADDMISDPWLESWAPMRPFLLSAP